MANPFAFVVPTQTLAISEHLCTNRQIVSSGKNSRYTVYFTGGATLTESSRIAIANIRVPYSWYNITALKGNNTFEYIVPFRGQISRTVVIPDGHYTISELNTYLQSVFILHGDYLVDNNGKYVYYGEIVFNLVRYRAQFSSYQFPAALPVGWTDPNTLFPTPPGSTDRGVYFLIPSTMGLYFGLDIPSLVREIPADSSIANVSELSDTSPVVEPIQALFIHCSYANNRLNPVSTGPYGSGLHGADTVVGCVQIRTVYGDYIHGSQLFAAWIPLKNSATNRLDFWVTDQENKDVIFEDTGTVIEFLLSNTQK